MKLDGHMYRGHKVYVGCMGGAPTHFKGAFMVLRCSLANTHRLVLKGTTPKLHASEEVARQSALAQARAEVDSLIHNQGQQLH